MLALYVYTDLYRWNILIPWAFVHSLNEIKIVETFLYFPSNKAKEIENVRPVRADCSACQRGQILQRILQL